MFKSLLTSTKFAPLFWCQFLSALNDNFIKNALVMLILYRLGSEHGQALVTLAGVVFMAPFFLLSAYGGEMADRHDKAQIAQKLKGAEIGVAAAGALGFLIEAAGYPLPAVAILFLALAGFGVIGALFGPVKYGILPDHLETSQLSAANALVEAATFAAILIGTIAAGLLASHASAAPIFAAVGMILAIACWVAAKRIPPAPAAAPDLVVNRNPWTSTLALIKELKADKRLWVGSLIVSWFWLVGGVALSLLPTIAKDSFHGTEGVVTLGLLVFTVGIAIGSVMAARAGHLRPNMALVPIGALLMSLFTLDIAWIIAHAETPDGAITVGAALSSITGERLLFDLLALAIGGGLYIVPSFASVQAWAPADKRARVIAGVNVLSAGFIVGSGAVVALLQALGVGPAAICAGLGLAGLIALGVVARAWGREGVRDTAAIMFRTFYRIEVEGLENLPAQGTRMVIAPNHVSFLDPAIVHACLPIDAMFAADTTIASQWWFRPFHWLVRVYKIDPTKPFSARALTHIVKDGNPLVIFPEGRITVTGGLMKVYDGTAMIADKGDAVVVPVRIEGAEQTHFAYLRKTQMKRSWFPKIRVKILPPVKLTVDPALKGRARRLAAGAILQDVMVDSEVKCAHYEQTLFSALNEARRNRDTGKPIIEDPLGIKLSYRKLMLGAQVLSKKLEAYAGEGEAVGVMLPNSAAVVVAFFSLQSIGRVPAMINFSAGSLNVLSALRTAKVNVLLTSRAFIERGRLDKLIAELEGKVRIVYLEDVRASITKMDKLAGFALGTAPRVRRLPDDPAVILFTSGSEGTPKGVVLSHKNILVNAAQALSRVAANGEDKVFNVLPVFHAFGLTGGLIMPLLAGVPIYLYPSPLHYRIVPELVYQTNATILFGTDTFLNGYARSAHCYDFRSLRMIMAGAEAVKDRTRQVYAERFGVRVLEGYGVTETAPMLAINSEIANKAGTVGRLAPLMEYRLDPVPGITEGGRLFVKGPNVMLGYLKADNPGVLEKPEGGWYDTGDIVTIDAQGFIAIKGRAKRFAKIAGEMVSLSAVEAMVAELWPASLSCVVTLPDARKGERLVLLTTQKDATRDVLLKSAKAKGLSELWVPADVLVLDKIPVLGSGKTDYVGATALATERAAAKSEPKAEPSSTASAAA